MNIVVVLDNIRSVQNVGSLFRTANCFGVCEILLCGTTPAPIDRFGRLRPDFQKVSLGADRDTPWRQFEQTANALGEIRQQGYDIFAIEQSENAVMLQDLVLQTSGTVPSLGNNFDTNDIKVAIVLGNEVTGVDPSLFPLCDLVLEIPQWGTKESLNVCNAGAIVLYHLRAVTDIIGG